MKAPPINVAEEEQKGLQKIGLQKRSTKNRSTKKAHKKVCKQKSAEKTHLKKYTPVKSRSPKNNSKRGSFTEGHISRPTIKLARKGGWVQYGRNVYHNFWRQVCFYWLIVSVENVKDRWALLGDVEPKGGGDWGVKVKCGKSSKKSKKVKVK